MYWIAMLVIAVPATSGAPPEFAVDNSSYVDGAKNNLSVAGLPYDTQRSSEPWDSDSYCRDRYWAYCFFLEHEQIRKYKVTSWDTTLRAPSRNHINGCGGPRIQRNDCSESLADCETVPKPFATRNIPNFPALPILFVCDAFTSNYIPIVYNDIILIGYLINFLTYLFLRISMSYHITPYRSGNIIHFVILILIPISFGAPIKHPRSTGGVKSSDNVSNDVSISSSVVGGVNTTEHSRVCWQNSDCVLYPPCKHRPSSCRCLSMGNCVLLRGHGQKCTSNDSCEEAMYCLSQKNPSNDNTGPRITGVCRCKFHARYNQVSRQCMRSAMTQDMPRFADLPDPGGEDADVPKEIPATYGGAILVGFLSLGLVIVCLCLTMWCHYTSSRLRAQLQHSAPQSNECLFPSNVHPNQTTNLKRDDRSAEKIPLDMCIPPPEMYQTPGFQNYSTIHDGGASTSHAQESLGMLGAGLSRTLR